MNGRVYYRRRMFRSSLKEKNGRNKCGVGVQLVFQLAQHLRDELLLESFVTYFNCGRLVRVVENH